MSSDIILAAQKITKTYQGVVALDQVDYTVYRHKVNVLIGENGAGKSTLMKVLAGVEEKTSGTFLLEGKCVNFASTKQAEKNGISIIFQELNLFPNLSISDNIFIGREIFENGVISQKKQALETVVLLKRLGLSLNPHQLLGELGIGQQQLIEIARALGKQSNILIMDEPTSALSQIEVEILFKVIADLKKRGVTLIYISHRLEELIEIGDYITVLRDGKLIVSSPLYKNHPDHADIDLAWIIEKMVGQAHQKFQHKSASLGKEALVLSNIFVAKPQGGFWVNDVSFSLKRGEIIGVYGLLGAGRTQLFKAIMGSLPIFKGEITLNNKSLRSKNYRSRLYAGMSLVPEDRKKEGIIPLMSILQNITLTKIGKGGFFKWLYPISGKTDAHDMAQMQVRLTIKVSDPYLPVTALSGGNQQKIVLGKMLLMLPEVILLDEPTRGIDVGAKTDVYQLISDLAHQGMAVIFSSSELEEVMSLADRILVMAEGQLRGDFQKIEATQSKIIKASTPNKRS